MHRKSENFEKFKEFREEKEKQLGKPIKALRLDLGREYLDEEFRSYLTNMRYCHNSLHQVHRNKIVLQKEGIGHCLT